MLVEKKRYKRDVKIECKNLMAHDNRKVVLLYIEALLSVQRFPCSILFSEAPLKRRMIKEGNLTERKEFLARENGFFFSRFPFFIFPRVRFDTPLDSILMLRLSLYARREMERKEIRKEREGIH